MKKFIIGLIAVGALAACGSGGNSMIPQSGSTVGDTSASQGQNYKWACDVMAPGEQDVCFALVRTDVGGAPGAPNYGRVVDATSTPAGYGPSQLQAAYALPSSSKGSGQTVALIESGDYPTAQADLNTYRAQYGLPACGSGCFTKVSQTGSTTSLPATNASWAEESALDMDMVSAVCPNCKIIMVEANSATNANLAAATNEAAALGATEISNSYGGSESGASNSAYNHAGIVITASSGDSGYAGGVEQPCSYSTVVCTGGSSLVTASNARGYSETVWNDLSSGHGAASSGCSADVESRRGKPIRVARSVRNPTSRSRLIRCTALPFTTARRMKAIPVGWSSAALALLRRPSLQCTHLPVTHRRSARTPLRRSGTTKAPVSGA